MNFQISGHHIEVTRALRTYVSDKLGRPLGHVNDAHNVDVLLKAEPHKRKGDKHTVTISVCVTGDRILVTKTHEDMYAAIDLAMDMLDRRLVSRKTKLAPRKVAVKPHIAMVETFKDRRVVSNVVAFERRKTGTTYESKFFAQQNQSAARFG